MLAGLTDRAIAVSGSTRDFLVRERFVPADRVRLDLERRAPRRVRAGLARSGPARSGAELGHARRRPGGGRDRPPQRPEGPRATCSMRRPRGRWPPIRTCASSSWATATCCEPLAGAGARGSGIAERVSFAGHRTDVPDLLGAIDVLAIPSLYEGTPLALFEAMAAGKAIVSSAVDGCAEVLEDGRTALLVPPADAAPWRAALVDLLGDPARRKALREAARAASRQYDISTCVAQMQDAVRGGPGRARAEAACRVVDVPCLGSSWGRPRRPGGPARPRCSAAIRRSSPGAHFPGATCPCSSSTASSPRASAASSDIWPKTGTRTLSADEYYQGLVGARRVSREGGAADLRRRPRQPVERRGSAPAPPRHARRGASSCRAGCASRPGPLPPSLDDIAAASGRRARTKSGTRGRATGRSCPGRRLRPRPVGSLRVPEPHPDPRPHPRGAAVGGLRDSRFRPGLRRHGRALGPRRRAGPLRRGRAPGHPFLRSASRTSEELRFFEEPGCARPAWRRWRRGRGRASFAVPTGRAGCARSSRRRADRRPLERPEEREAALRARAGRGAPCDRGAHRPERHPSLLPWHTAGPTARRLAREAGYRTAFCGKVPEASR